MKKVVLIILGLFVVGACASMSHGPAASAALTPTSGSSAHGTVQLSQMADGSVEVVANLAGVPPGVHGFHIHEKGDCGDNGNAAGGHFNPMSVAHGSPSADPHHAGDWGNVTADGDGNVNTRFITHSISLNEGPTSASGHAIILHANPDDLTTQPSGNAGARIACGIVTLK
jgi:Cu-Zn family superoxide dismutase